MVKHQDLVRSFNNMIDSPWNVYVRKRSHVHEDAPRKKLPKAPPSFYKKLTRSHCSTLVSSRLNFPHFAIRYIPLQQHGRAAIIMMVTPWWILSNSLVVQELPCKFVRTYGIRLANFVSLRWLHVESPVYNVACTRRMDKDKRRISFTDGWKEFKTESGLQAGQELEFILFGESSFIVRQRLDCPPAYRNFWVAVTSYKHWFCE